MPGTTLTVAASVRRSYMFPAKRAPAFAWHCDIDRLLGLLPHVSVVRKDGDAAYRLVYSAREAGLYRVTIHCDVRIVSAPDRGIASGPLRSAMPAQAGWYSMSGSGRFEETIAFAGAGARTRIECSIGLDAKLPVALSLRVVPRARLDAAADRIFRRRLDEIMDTFVERSIMAYSR
ncbi:MAG: hypothetical protein U1F17_03860 [Burkholderiaceae bacterium]